MTGRRRLSARIYLLRAIYKYIRNTSKTKLITASFIGGFGLGLFPTLLSLINRNRAAETSSSTTLSLRYESATPSSPSYAFFFTTGRSGPQHYSRILTHPSAFITHQQEHPTTPTKRIVDAVYRTLAKSTNLTTFHTHVTHHLHAHKIPFFHSLTTRAHHARFIYTGHLPLAFGQGPALLT